MMGFVNGLAIVIGKSQIGMFKSGDDWLTGEPLWVMIGLVALTMGIMFGLPKINKNIPAALVAILVVSAIVIFGDIPTETVRSFIEGKGGNGINAGLLSLIHI